MMQIVNSTLQDHSQQLVKHIVDQIHQHGSVSFADYMQLTLHTPGLGYYSGPLQKLGAGGDFVTAPELGPLFAHCLSAPCQQVLEALGGGVIFELGAGTGQLAVDLIRCLEKSQAPLEHYYILETSADLRQRQQEKFLREFPEGAPHVTWLERLPETPLRGVILANEVLDVLPVHRFEWHEDKVYELRVGRQHGKFVWQKHIANPSLEEAVNALSLSEYGCLNGYQSEINLYLRPWLASLQQCLQQGVMLLIDYGFLAHEYYHADRREGTLMCHHQHRCHSDPFLYPGLQDITAHVDFSAMGESAEKLSMEILGYTQQARFLMDCELLDHWQRLNEAQPKQQHRWMQAIDILTSPAEMGELFKVMALGQDFNLSLKGFV